MGRANVTVLDHTVVPSSHLRTSLVARVPGAPSSHVNPEIFNTGLTTHFPAQSWGLLNAVDSRLCS